MLSFEEAQAALRALDVASRVERVPLNRAGARTTAAHVALDRDQPGFDRATMDGYALCLAPRDRYRVVGTVFAGTTFDGELEAGDALRIMTGAPCPPNVTVVPIERTDGGTSDAGTEWVKIADQDDLRPGRNIAWRGEDGRAGDVVLQAGTRLGPAALSVAAMAGAAELDVYAAPRVAVVTTGDEVGQAGAAGIRDSNGPLLEAFLAGMGVPVTRAHAPDVEEVLEERLRVAADSAEIVVTVGGVSMGARDLIPGSAAKLGFETVFHKVAIQPGKPVFVAQREGRLFIGLPGNPVSVLATAHLFLAPAIEMFQGGATSRWKRLPMAEDYEHRGRRRLFLPAGLREGGVVPVAWNGSGDLLAAATGDGFVDLEAGAAFSAGDLVSFLPFVGHVPGQCGVLPPRTNRN